MNIQAPALCGLKAQTSQSYRVLAANEPVQYGDLVEDLKVGDRAPVEKGTFYGFLNGVPAAKAKDLPAVHSVVRKVTPEAVK